MSMKSNCWEVMSCGREAGGAKNAEMGVCPAALEVSCDELNGGKNAGRICWAVSGTFCGGIKQGTFAQKQLSCMTCDFFNQVQAEEGVGRFMLLKPGQTYQQ